MSFWGTKKFMVRTAVGAFLLLGCPVFLFALPEGEQVAAGEARFDRGTCGILSVTAGSDRTVVNYSSFSIGAQESVYFALPAASSCILNRVVGGDPSHILGQLSSNGQVWLVNPNGILFGAGARLDVAGLVASTLDIADADFLSGQYRFAGSGSGIVNEGFLRAQPGGYIVLLGAGIDNRGSIEAALGTVVLAAGERMTVALDDRNAISVMVEEPVRAQVLGPDGTQMEAAINNAATICAEGGKVILNACVLKGLFDQAINNSGVIEAAHMGTREGVVELLAEGGDIENSGTLSADRVLIKAAPLETILNTNIGKIRADGTLWMPAGGWISLEAGRVIQAGLISANAYEAGDAGTIDIVGWSQVILDEHSRTEACAPGLAGNGGRVTVVSPNGNTFVRANARIDVSAGSVGGNGGFAEVSAFDQIGFYGVINGRAPPGYQRGFVLFDPQVINGDIILVGVDYTLLSNDGITVNAAISVTDGSITLTADADGDGAGDFLQNSGSIQTISSGSITISGASITLISVSSAGALSVTSTAGLSVGGAGLSAQQLITLKSGTALLLAASIATPQDAFLKSGTSITQSAGSIIAAGLRVEAQGDIVLTGTSNDVDTLCGKIVPAGSFSYTDAESLTIGKVQGGRGISTRSGDITIICLDGALSVTEQINAGMETLTLQTAESAEAVAAGIGFSQILTALTIRLISADGIDDGSGGRILAGNLAVFACGGSQDDAVILDNANHDVSNLAAAASGSGRMAFTFRDADDLTVSDVEGLGGITTNGGDLTLTAGGTLTVGLVNGGRVQLTSLTGGIQDDADETNRISASTLILSSALAIGSAASGGALDIETASVSASAAGGGIYLSENSGAFFETVTAAGEILLSANGSSSFGAITGSGRIYIQVTSGDATLKGTVRSLAGSVYLYVDAGSLYAAGAGPHLVSAGDAFLSVPQGTIGIGAPLYVEIGGGILVVDVGGLFGLDSAFFAGSLSPFDLPYLYPTSYPSPLYPRGRCYFNGVRFWPPDENREYQEFLVQASYLLSERYLILLSEQTGGLQITPMDLMTSGEKAGLLYYYHPLTDMDMGAFDEFFAEEGAFEFIDGVLERTGGDGFLKIFEEEQKKKNRAL